MSSVFVIRVNEAGTSQKGLHCLEHETIFVDFQKPEKFTSRQETLLESELNQARFAELAESVWSSFLMLAAVAKVESNYMIYDVIYFFNESATHGTFESWLQKWQSQTTACCFPSSSSATWYFKFHTLIRCRELRYFHLWVTLFSLLIQDTICCSRSWNMAPRGKPSVNVAPWHATRRSCINRLAVWLSTYTRRRMSLWRLVCVEVCDISRVVTQCWFHCVS